MKLLWLPGWYPNKTEPYSGDFIQRHAKAVSLYNTVQVIHVVRDKYGVVTKKVKEEDVEYGDLKEKIVYYYTPVISISIIDKIISSWRYYALYKTAIRKYLLAEGTPVCAHVHVVNKNGFAALWVKRKYKIPYCVSEHGVVYVSGAVPSFNDNNWWFKRMWNKLMNAASGLSVVSHYLGESIRKIKPDTRFTVIPNVVNDTVFFPHTKNVADKITSFIHISTLGYQKNPEMILQAFGLVKKENPLFMLSVFGPPKKELEELADKLGLKEHVSFHNEIPQQELAVFLQGSDALILYSRYETFGCVLIEANACGVPAIVSELPVFHEIIEEGVNGYFVPGEDPEALAQKLLQFMHQSPQVPDNAIALAANEKYNYARVGKQFGEFYEDSLRV